MALLEVRGLVKYYGRRAVVDGIDFDVDAGEVVGLLGPNGAGKTTTFRIVTGQISPNAGRVSFNGQDVTSLPMYRRARLGMGYLSQETSVFRKLTVEQNLFTILEAMPACRSLGRALNRRERWERTDAALDQFGLTKVRKNRAASLSGGEKRRLEIARCLVCEPLLILLDEPFTGIDPLIIEDIRAIVRDLRRQDIGILLTDHNVREALKITDRGYLIAEGKVQTQGTSREIVSDPVAIKSYLGSSFQADSPVTPSPALDAAVRPALPLVLELERIRRLVEALKSADRAAAAGELIRRGPDTVPTLLDALERRDVEMRQLALHVLQAVLKGAVAFDPFAPEAERRRQIAALRDRHERKAG